MAQLNVIQQQDVLEGVFYCHQCGAENNKMILKKDIIESHSFVPADDVVLEAEDIAEIETEDQGGQEEDEPYNSPEEIVPDADAISEEILENNDSETEGIYEEIVVENTPESDPIYQEVEYVQVPESITVFEEQSHVPEPTRCLKTVKSKSEDVYYSISVIENNVNSSASHPETRFKEVVDEYEKPEQILEDLIEEFRPVQVIPPEKIITNSYIPPDATPSSKKCGVCSQIFENEYSRRDHYRDSLKCGLICFCCRKKFHKRFALKQHLSHSRPCRRHFINN